MLALLLPLATVLDSGLVLHAVRFYRADPRQSPGQTHVTAFIEIPPDLPKPGRAGEVSVQLSIRVVDDGGKPLYQQSWPKRSTVPAARGDADRRDFFRFTLGAGAYRLEATAVDSVSGRRSSATVPIEGYGEPPALSDLLLSTWVRPVTPADTVPEPGEFRRGGMILAVAPRIVVGGPGASLAYLFETYSGSALDGTLDLEIVDSGGAVRRAVGPTPVRVVAGIGMITGQVEVGDAGRGDLRLRATLTLGARSTVREADFVIDPAVGSSPAALSDDDYFARLAEPELDRAFAPLAAIAPPAELAGWPARGSAEEKRAFLAGFWRKRDPAPSAAGNERRSQFYDGIVYANAFYADSARRVPGWRTDRGRVFLRAGLPTQVLRRQQRGPVPAYEVWRYFERVPRYYLFVDRPGSESYRLIRSNDPTEPKDRRWQEILTPAGVREVVAFLGREVLN
jgi:GWxTD domain-containing protein